MWSSSNVRCSGSISTNPPVSCLQKVHILFGNRGGCGLSFAMSCRISLLKEDYFLAEIIVKILCFILHGFDGPWNLAMLGRSSRRTSI